MRAKWIMMAPLSVVLLTVAQERPAGIGVSLRLANGLFVAANTYCDPLLPGQNPFACLDQNEIGAHLLFHPDTYIIVARRSKTWFGYSFTAEKSSQGDTIRLTIGPPSLSAGPAGYMQLPLPKFDSGPFTLAPGDILRMPLLVNPTTGQTLFNELQFFTSSPSHEEAFGPSAGIPRDFALQDVQMNLRGTLLVNDKDVKITGGSRGGPVIFYGKQGFGTTFLSVIPQAEPFRKAGVIRDRTLRFQIGTDQYEWRCAEPILPGDGAYNVYVYWDPAAATNDFYFGSAKSGEAAMKGIATPNWRRR
jgi:hypothetical protein